MFTAMRAPRFLLLALCGGLTGCLLTVPDEKDDGVSRCGNPNDCPESDDNRFTFGCGQGEGQSGDSEQVCFPAYATIDCNQAAFDPDDFEDPPATGVDYFRYLAGVAKADSEANNVNLCETDQAGKNGCQPKGGDTCDDGEVVEFKDKKFCSPSGTLTVPARVDSSLFAADVRDQFCRWSFCDDSFICGSNGSCIPCVPGEALDNGGCREIYREGDASKVYLNIASNCNEGDQTMKDLATDSDVFGSLE